MIMELRWNDNNRNKLWFYTKKVTVLLSDYILLQ